MDLSNGKEKGRKEWKWGSMLYIETTWGLCIFPLFCYAIAISIMPFLDK